MNDRHIEWNLTEAECRAAEADRARIEEEDAAQAWLDDAPALCERCCLELPIYARDVCMNESTYCPDCFAREFGQLTPYTI